MKNGRGENGAWLVGSRQQPASEPGRARSIGAALAFAQIVVFGTTTHGLAMTGEQLLPSCELLLRDTRRNQDGKVYVPSGGMTCWNYMAAVQDVSTLADDQTMRPLIGFCAPPESTLMQYIRIFVEHARRTPAQLHNSAAWVATAALTVAFPCR